MLTEDDLRKIEAIVKEHKSSGGDGGCLLIIFILFLMGVFKSCGY
jgi:hypothetical protein